MTGTRTPATVPSDGSSLSPDAKALWMRSRGLLAAVAVLLVAGIVLAVLRSGEQYGLLDPRSPERSGSLATAELLAQRGVDTTVVTTTAEAADAAGPDTTVLVAAPDLLGDRQLNTLRAAFSGSGGRTLLLAPGPGSVERLAPRARAVGSHEVAVRAADCAAPFASRAGDAELGGYTYTSSADEVDSCYPAEDLPSLLRLPDATGDGDTVVLGSGDLLQNHRLDQHGNASLALQLLGSRPHLVWYLPSLADQSSDEAGDLSVAELVPPGWRWAALQLAVAAVLTALWRARRLGPLVPERLPVTVYASEATEGRARLYQQARARGSAAQALRSDGRARLAALCGVPAAQADNAEVLTAAVASHSGGTGGEVHHLLFGPPPADDDALVNLADELDRLRNRVSPSPAPRDKDRPS
ncbi:DUF4350 domain-containing protein [Streptomyces sp. 549]|uniref:DUF4350 domain-containing protein n=1 Tax=Streptomyces sp. 549 TaxID=3049076 RepID=UPI0024C45BA7|nr:DUF4350 domain-containing protein [Streptomyces sp. 549]MDK1476930.1 DUF4350 domain-containing protein [Streptomyces sp. 549]